MNLTVADLNRLKQVVVADANAMLLRLDAEISAINNPVYVDPKEGGSMAYGVTPPPNDPSHWEPKTPQPLPSPSTDPPKEPGTEPV